MQPVTLIIIVGVQPGRKKKKICSKYSMPRECPDCIYAMKVSESLKITSTYLWYCVGKKFKICNFNVENVVKTHEVTLSLYHKLDSV